jgi:two-component system, NtrC family, nitrogen regulation response regulator NtrX
MKENTGAAPRIMIVDSDPFVRDSLKFFFDRGQVHHLIFKSGEQGLNALKYQDFDVVVCDYFLPDMDGVHFLNRVKETSGAVFRILMATLITDRLVSEIKAAGIDRFIEKPLTVALLDTMINELTGCRQPEHNMGHEYNTL